MSSALVERPQVHITSDEALRIVRTDAEEAYGDLSDYCITIALGLDGWHIDYELMDPQIKGGGPHYVVDASNGTVVSKRYDQ